MLPKPTVMLSKVLDLSNFTEIDWIKGIVKKDRLIIGLFYDHYSPTLYGHILACVKEEDIAVKIMVEAFLKIVSSMPEYLQTDVNLFTWMIWVINNEILKQTRDG